MTTQTRVLPDLDESLDFEPTCKRAACDASAQWSGQLPCRCELILLCTTHKVDTDRTLRSYPDWTCRCGAVVTADGVTWRPL